MCFNLHVCMIWYLYVFCKFLFSFNECTTSTMLFFTMRCSITTVLLFSLFCVGMNVINQLVTQFVAVPRWLSTPLTRFPTWRLSTCLRISEGPRWWPSRRWWKDIMDQKDPRIGRICSQRWNAPKKRLLISPEIPRSRCSWFFGWRKRKGAKLLNVGQSSISRYIFFGVGLDWHFWNVWSARCDTYTNWNEKLHFPHRGV